MPIDLKAYTSYIKDLEAAVYTEKSLIESHQAILDEQRPKKPEKRTIDPPPPPEEPNYIDLKNTDVGGSIGGIILGLFFLCFRAVFGGFLFTIGGLIFIFIGIYLIPHDIQSTKSYKSFNQRLKEQFEKEKQEYPIILQKYEQELSDIDSEYENALKTHIANYSTHTRRIADTMCNHRLALSQLELALEKAYNEHIIFPKYRNFIAITAINEYLMSGRCDKLEGPDGAYNLYEMELRQNLIINQLSIIISNLEQIRNNQYSLYQELQKSNRIVNEILLEARDINRTTKLNAYFSAITAMAEISPKYYS